MDDIAIQAAARQIRAKVCLTVAVVLDRYDLIQRAWGTIAEAIYRLGPIWTEAALRVQRNGW